MQNNHIPYKLLYASLSAWVNTILNNHRQNLFVLYAKNIIKERLYYTGLENHFK